MAFGKPPDKKKFPIPVIEDQLWRANVRGEEIACESWNSKWGWILDEYGKLHKQLTELAEDSVMLKDLKKEVRVDPRTIRPIPESVSHEYGWLSTRPEFQLEKFGPDCDKGLPVPEIYRINTNIPCIKK